MQIQAIQHISRRAGELKNWDDVTAMLNQNVFLEPLERPRVSVFTVNANDIDFDSDVIDKKVLHKIKNSLKDVPRVLTTIVDSIEVECCDDKITCTKIFVQARKELVVNFSWKHIIRMNIISSNTVLYIDTITRIYAKRMFP